ncbi:MAG: hypothetical protein WAU95_16140 [Anaerolineae bacterium]
MANLSRTFGNRSRRTGEAIWIMLGVLLLGCALALPLGASDDTALALILLGTAVIAYLVFPSRWQLWSLVAIAVYFQPLEALQLPISQSNVHLLDLFVAMTLVGWLIRWALQMHTWRLTRRSGYLLAAILAILLIPALVGMLKGNIVVTVLRDMRVPFYYITLSLLVVSSVRTRADLVTTLRGIALLILPALAYYFVSWALGIPTSEGASTVILSSGRYLRYGLVTSWEYIMLSWLLGLAFFLTGDVPPQWRPWLALYTLLSTVALMALLVRGIYLGMLGGLVTVVLFSHWLRNPQRLISAGLVLLVLGGLVVAADAAAGTGLVAAVGERVLSIVDPRASTSSSAANRETRLETTRFIGNSARGTSNPLIGAGYGDRGAYAYSRDSELQALFRHSAYSWLFYRVGFVQGILILLLFAVVAWRAGRLAWRMENSLLRATIVTFLAAFIANFFVGLGNNTIFDFFGAFSVQVAIEFAILIKLDLLLQPAVSA